LPKSTVELIETTLGGSLEEVYKNPLGRAASGLTVSTKRLYATAASNRWGYPEVLARSETGTELRMVGQAKTGRRVPEFLKLGIHLVG
jgi:hypothetical protein